MAQLDLSGLPRLGNMLSGGGLNAIFDGAGATSGYIQATSGWCGLDFGAPVALGKVEFQSPSNGFDASGFTAAIVLKVYGTDTLPTVGSTGTLLASQSFTDVNAVQLKELIISSPAAYRYYTFAVETSGFPSVWAVLAEVRCFDTETPSLNFIEMTGGLIVGKSLNVNLPLPWATAELPETRIFAHFTEAGVATLHWSASVEHAGGNFAVGIGFSIEHRYSADPNTLMVAPLTRILNATRGVNISEHNPDHYGDLGFPASLPIVPGYYCFAITGSAHSSASSSNGLARLLAENGKGLNEFSLRFQPGANFLKL